MGKRGLERVKQDEFITVKGMHEPIIGVEAFMKVQEGLEKHKAGESAKWSNVYRPLSGLIKCAICERNLVVEGKGKSARQYICRHARILREEEYLKVRIKEDDLLMAVANVIYFAVRLQKEKPRKADLENIIEQKTSGAGGNSEVEKRKLMELYEKYNSGDISKEFFLSEKRAIQKQTKSDDYEEV